MKPACLVLLFSAMVLAQDPVSEWKFRQEFGIERPGLVKLALPDETLDAARPELQDLRILDGSGAEIPYLVQQVQHPDPVRLSAQQFEVLLQPDATVVTVKAEMGRPVSAIHLETPAEDFIKAVDVQGSLDSKSWTTLISGAPIFRKRGVDERLRIDIPQGEWAFLRITIDDSRSGPIPVSAIRLHPVPQLVPQTEVSVRIKDRREDPGITRLELDLGARNLRLSSLRVETADPLFTRTVRVRARQVIDRMVQENTVASGTIRRVAIEGQAPVEQLEVFVDRHIATRDLLLLIENGGSPPVSIKSVTAARHPVYIVFHARSAGAYSLLTGNPRAAQPSYDIGFLSSQLKRVPVSSWVVGSVSENPSYRPAEALPELAQSVTPFDVSAWTYRKSVKTNQVGVQELALDLEVLSHGQNDFSDLRLMQEGKQIPYLLESTSWTRPLLPAVAAEEDAKNPRVSRWQLKLPYPSLPIRDLACKSRMPLFKRSLRLYEMVTDERGSARERTLGSADWVQTVSDPGRFFLISVGESPQTETLFLETDNGDNPALQLEGFVFYYPVTRLLFKPPAGGDLFLYYGNAKAGFPQYDIGLAAQQLLEAEKSEATSEVEQRLQGPALREKVARKAGVLFWIALGIAVVALLFAVSRLLPKSKT